MLSFDHKFLDWGFFNAISIFSILSIDIFIFLTLNYHSTVSNLEFSIFDRTLEAFD